MRKFVERALNKLSKLEENQIHSLIYDLASDNEQMEAVLESLADGILVADEQNQIILANKAVRRLIPIHTNDVNILYEVIGDQDIADCVQQAIENEEQVIGREFILDGSSKILSLSVLPLVKAGSLRGNLVHITDISEKRLKEARLRRAENLANLANITAGVAHEIKNPLGSISIHIQLMQRILENSGKEDEKNLYKHKSDFGTYLNIISDEVERLNRIVVDYLFAVRPIDINLELEDLNQILHEIVEFLKYELEEAKVTVSENYQPDIPQVLIDLRYMKQAILNIVKNAIHAMPDGGQLSLATSFADDSLCLSISDTGVGITEDIMEKIFDPYFTTRDVGSGIGLTIVYKIVKEHRGEITVKSEVGKGTNFYIYLPVQREQRNLLGAGSLAEGQSVVSKFTGVVQEV